MLDDIKTQRQLPVWWRAVPGERRNRCGSALCHCKDCRKNKRIGFSCLWPCGHARPFRNHRPSPAPMAPEVFWPDLRRSRPRSSARDEVEVTIGSLGRGADRGGWCRATSSGSADASPGCRPCPRGQANSSTTGWPMISVVTGLENGTSGDESQPKVHDIVQT